MEGRDRFWQRWLLVVTIVVAAFGLALVIAPPVGRGFFSLLIYGSPSRIDEMGTTASAYITLAHGVLGAVMFGWAVALLLIVMGPFARGFWEGWLILAVSVTAWFIPDTVISLSLGFWPNAVQNAVFATLFAIPLAATYRSFRQRKGPEVPSVPSGP
jgi:hypothetical protein